MRREEKYKEIVSYARNHIYPKTKTKRERIGEEKREEI